MLFGESTPPSEAERLLSQAAEAGIDFFDTAEMYPVPQRAETQVWRVGGQQNGGMRTGLQTHDGRGSVAPHSGQL